MNENIKILLTLVFALVLFSLSSISFLSAKNKDVMKYQVYVVVSDSMKPSFSKGSILLTKKIENTKNINKDSIITFKYPLNLKRTITHRIVDIEYEEDQAYFITKGDAHALNDPWRVTEDMLIAQSVFAIPLVGHVIQFIRMPVGLISLIIIPLGILMFLEGESLVREINSKVRVFYKRNQYKFKYYRSRLGTKKGEF